MFRTKTKVHLPKSMTAATPLDRISAQLIDIIFLYSIYFVLSHYFKTTGEYIAYAVFAFYFFVSHLVWGQTLGKKIVGLRVISIDAESINIWRLLLREGSGRFLSIFLCFIGYLRILYTKDHRGLHDVLSGTVVITEKKLQGTFLRVVGVMFSVLLVFSFAGYRILFKTPAMGFALTLALHKEGVQVGRVSGNLLEGWTIDVIQGENAYFQYQLKSIQIAHDKKNLYKNAQWNFSQITVGEVNINFNANAFNLSFLRKDSFSNQQASVSADLTSVIPNSLKVMVYQMNVQKLNLYQEQVQMISASEIFVKDTYLNRSELTFKQIYSQHENLKFQIWDSSYSLMSGKLTAKAKVHAKANLHPQLRSPLDLQMVWQGTVNEPELLRFTAFENRLALELNKNELSLQTYSFTPSRYFKASPSFKNITMKMRNNYCKTRACLGSLNGYGAFYIHNKKIEFKDEVARGVGSELDLLRFSANDLIQAVFEPTPVLKVISEEGLLEYISLFYFNKNYATVTPEERQIVHRDQVYFKVLKERFDPNRPEHRDTFLIRSPSQIKE